jgi:hypothetical protein
VAEHGERGTACSGVADGDALGGVQGGGVAQGDVLAQLAFGGLSDEPPDTKLVGIPHYMMRESDRNAFLNPSGGVQLPKLREAVRSLKLAHAINSDSAAEQEHRCIPKASGHVVKAGGLISVYQSAVTKYVAQVEAINSPFDIKLLAVQVQNECIWPNGQGGNAANFGGPNASELGYVNRPAFDAHLLSWEGAVHAEQVRPGDAGQGCPSGAGAPRGLSE